MHTTLTWPCTGYATENRQLMDLCFSFEDWSLFLQFLSLYSHNAQWSKSIVRGNKTFKSCYNKWLLIFSISVGQKTLTWIPKKLIYLYFKQKINFEIFLSFIGLFGYISFVKSVKLIYSAWKSCKKLEYGQW